MTDRSAVAFRIMGSRATLLGAEDSLEGINTYELDDGALCYVTAAINHYSLDKTSTASPSPPNTIKPVAGPGLWAVATGGTPGAQGFQGFQGAQGLQGTQGAGSQGAQGATGTQGNQGFQGTQGAGFQGAQGATGTQGNQGFQGTQGAGFQGAQGFQGATGAQGLQGNTGAQGTTGAQGQTGPQGATGTQGAQGFQGTQGTGAQGSQGSAGPQGPGGGAQGAQGATGTQGNQGSQGATGAGFQGAQGNQGATGAQGLQGSQGAQGFQGTAGSQGATGTGAQGAQGATGAGTQGAQGATGLQGNQGFQGTTGAGTQGSQGATGAQGNQGFQGTTGSGTQGAQGAAGTAGAQGNQGFQGARGAQGFQGLQGLQGQTGSQGATGAQGLQGTIGAQGTAGTAGGTGAQGNQGFQGATGAGTQGAQGATGTQGNQGFQGTTGSGAQGAQGATGTAGAQGSQGFQGARGAQGFQGLQGSQGATGTQGSQGGNGAQGLQGTTGAQGLQGTTGAQGLQGTAGTGGAQGSQGSQGAGAASINPLTQWVYVDSANAGVQTGSIAQPYVSPTAAFAAHTTGNIALAIAAGTYATALSLSGDRDITMIGLCDPLDQTIILGSISVAFATTNGHTLTLQNISCTTITSTSAVQDNISLIDVIASGTLTGSGTTSTNTRLYMSSVLAAGLTKAGMQMNAITQLRQITAENAIISGVMSNMGLAVDEGIQKIFRGCIIQSTPTIGGYTAYDTQFLAGITFPGVTGTLNYFYNCIVQGNFGSVTDVNDQVWVYDCRLCSAATTTDLIGTFGLLNLYGTTFGPKTSGQVQLNLDMSKLGMDSVSEKSFWSSAGGRGKMNGAGLGSSNIYQALDVGEEDGQPIPSGNSSFNAINGNTRFVMALLQMTADSNVTLDVGFARPLQFYTVDVYGVNTHTLAIKFSGSNIYSTTSVDTFPQRVRLQVTDDGLAVVYVGTENL
jgi:hypothetical protein